MLILVFCKYLELFHKDVVLVYFLTDNNFEIIIIKLYFAVKYYEMENKKVSYTPSANVCSKLIEIEATNNIIESVKILGGCHGNLQGISSLLKGMNINDAISKLKGIDCKGKGTSCPDQISEALSQLL